MKKAILLTLMVILAICTWDGKCEAKTVTKTYETHAAGIDTAKATKAMKKADKKKAKAKKKAKEKKEYKRNLYLLSHLVYAENGDSSYSEYKKAMLYTGSVVLNRVKSKHFPNTIEGVIFQRGQYACTWDGHFERKPSKAAIKVAKKLLKHGSYLPSKVLYAAEFNQGKVYDKVAGTIYCY